MSCCRILHTRARWASWRQGLRLARGRRTPGGIPRPGLGRSAGGLRCAANLSSAPAPFLSRLVSRLSSLVRSLSPAIPRCACLTRFTRPCRLSCTLVYLHVPRRAIVATSSRVVDVDEHTRARATEPLDRSDGIARCVLLLHGGGRRRGAVGVGCLPARSRRCHVYSAVDLQRRRRRVRWWAVEMW